MVTVLLVLIAVICSAQFKMLNEKDENTVHGR
jgi:hypothetical protein